MAWLYSLLLFLQASPEAAPAADRLTWARYPSAVDAVRCMGRLRVHEARVRIRCQLDGRGAPRDCTLTEPEAVTPEQWTAVQCMAKRYRFRYPDDRSTEGAFVNLPITLQTSN